MFGVSAPDDMLRGPLLRLSDSKVLAAWLTHHRLGRLIARRFVAGEELDEAVDAVRALNGAGLLATLDHLGEAVANPQEATEAAGAYLDILDYLNRGRVDSNVSLKLTQLGLDISQRLCADNLTQVLERARTLGQFVRLDMESSTHTQPTLDVFQDAWRQGWQNCGIVLQAYLYRTEGDVEMAVEMGAPVRLCKGAYAEPASVAFPRKADTDSNYIKLARRLLDAGAYPAIATHDKRIIDTIRSWGLDKKSFEFQMLYGVRPDLQRRLVAEGYRLRAYVPFGSDWYAYFMRRLAERPANLRFFLTALLKEVGR
ncbi:MAG: proline dehydrogenase family protein [Chloroflexota bacterium]